jgi:putative ABC transport system ATP-binding protein
MMTPPATTAATTAATTLEPRGGRDASARSDAPIVAELRDLRKTYYKPDGSVMVEALRGVDLAIRKGEYVAIMGSSGSGKSTLMNVLGCLDRPSGGQYLLDGRDVGVMDDAEVSTYRGRTIGFIFQAFNLIPELTILENVAAPLFYQNVPRAQRLARAVEALRLVQLDQRLDHRPRELSGGQQQRVAIARALVTRPVVLMADEPTGNLDSATGRAILALFDDLHDSGVTIIMVTHDPLVALRCERVVRLKDGIVESDVRQTPQRPSE